MPDLGLGRVKSSPDPRDWKLTSFLASDPLDDALNEMLSHHYSRWFRAWAALMTARVKGQTPAPPTPKPPPTPPPAPPGQIIWSDSEPVLDQGKTPHCVGFGCADWGNTNPIDDHYGTADGHKFYYAAKVIDGEAGQEDGTSVRSGAKALKQAGRIGGYAFAQSFAEVQAWLRGHGPVLLGTNFYYDMYTPDGNGFITATGSFEGGHCYLALGDLPDEDAILFLNSWGPDWGLGGYFKMKTADVVKLLSEDGEALAAVELPL